MAELNVVELTALATGRPGAARRLASGESIGSLADQGPSLRVLSRQRAFNYWNNLVGARIGKFDPDNITMRQMAQMRRDPMMYMGLHYTKVPLLNAPWHIDCKDPQVAAFVENALRPIYNRLVMQMMASLEFGYAPIVLRFERKVPDWVYADPNDAFKTVDVWPNKNIPAVVWNEPRILPPRGAEVMFTPDGESYAGFRHTGLPRDEDDPRPVEIDAQHSLWYTNQRDEEFGNWYGFPLTGYAFRYWWSYWYVWLLLDKHMETDADPPLFVRYPEGTGPDPDDPSQQVSNYEIAMKGGDALRDGATMAASSEVYIDEVSGRPTGTYKWDAKFLTGGYNGQAFQQRLEHMEVLKLRALLVPEQALIEGAKGTGSRNVAEVYGAAFAEAQEIRKKDIDQHLNEYVIPDLVAQNFVDAPTAKIVTSGFRSADSALATQILDTIASKDPRILRIDYPALAEGEGLPVLDAGQELPDYGVAEPAPPGPPAPPAAK